MRWTIRYQLSLPLLILLLGVTAMSAWAAIAAAQHARDRIDTQVGQIAQTLEQSPPFPLTERVLLLIKGFSGADFLLLPADGQPITTLKEIPGPLVEDSDNAEIHLEHRIIAGETAYLYTAVQLRKVPAAEAKLFLFYPESLLQEAVWQAVRPSLYLGITSGMGAAVVTVLLAHRLTRRVRDLEQRTRLIAAGDFSPLPLPRSNDELRDLARSVNEMAEQLGKYQEMTRRTERLRLLGQVSGGLAHQLRNGVTGARLAVQLHARECHGSAEDESLQVALRQLGLIEMHLKRFLDLGRGGELKKSSCLLVPLLSESISLLQPQCRHNRIQLIWQPPETLETVRVNGDPGQLNHLFLNVITNAVEAAGPGGRVEMRLSQPDPTQIAIAVEDSGTGPSSQVAGQLFEPFVTGKPEGVGLGLSIARQVAEAHGGTIAWERTRNGTCFVIHLPAQDRQGTAAE
jgi:signal transduction histidine kinase